MKTTGASKPQNATGQTKPQSDINTSEMQQERQDRQQEGQKDKIDQLLNATASEKSKRTYKGYYVDSDVLGVLESVPTGKRSDLLNEVLRAAFKERGRL